MLAFGNHNRVSNVKEHLTTQNNCIVAANFEQECVSRPNDRRPMVAKLEYVGWVEEILELNYGILNFVVRLCTLTTFFPNEITHENFVNQLISICHNCFGITFIHTLNQPKVSSKKIVYFQFSSKSSFVLHIHPNISCFL
jgi:hypothetical protein